MTKYYLTWNFEEPVHPKEIYKESWNSGVSSGCYQLQPPDKTLNDWRNDKMLEYELLLSEYKQNGKFKALNVIYHPTPEDIKKIENDINFIEWCN